MIQIQSQIIQLCLSKCSENQNLSLVLAEILHINRDAAYRRIRGETLLNIEELQVLCTHFDISFDTLIHNSPDQVSFSFQSLYNAESLEDYLKGILGFLKIMQQSSDCSLTLVAMDLPIFRQLAFKNLREFMIYYWQKTVLQRDTLKNLRFELYEMSEELNELLEEISHIYFDIESTEIWSPETLVSTFKRIEYYHEAGYFMQQESIAQILNDIEKLIEQLRGESETGIKKRSSDFVSYESSLQLFNAEVYLSNNMFQVEKEGRTYNYLTYNTINSIMSSSNQITTECNQWVEHLKRNSVLLSRVSQKYREYFFSHLFNQLEQIRKKLLR